MFDLLRGKRRADNRFYAVKDVSFQVEPGESVALVGANGAGKSTILSLVAGLCEPDEGKVEVDGPVAALMELGAGFHYDLTGRENLQLNAALLGFSRKRTEDLAPAIVEFSGIGEFIDQQLRNLSAGMVMRLAFSIAVNLESDILIVDEVLAVGDEEFQEKCKNRIREVRRSGRTLLFVSHNAAVVKEFCDRAIWLDHGRLKLDGSAAEVLAAYSGSAHG
jgi:ABC-type polysaccharide/polyol phosphate transport system ATPase subunit